MQKLGHFFSLITAVVFRFLPWRVNYFFAKILAFIWIDVFQIRKNVILDNIKTAFPDIGPERQNEIAKNSMVALSRSFFDVMKIPSLTDKWIDQNVIFEGEENIKKIQSENSGMFFLCLHIGSGDLAGAIASRRIKPITLISKRFTNRFLDSFWFGLRERSQTLFIDAHAKNNAFEILSALKDKRGVVFVLDQFMGKPYGVESKFFGVTTGTAYGLALFAKKTNKPVYPLYTYWDEDHKLHICVEPAIDLSRELSETNEVITNKFNQVLERIIRLHPDHWMWVHKRWKTFE
ncbi:MAG: lysophospholipid acyltransferase family protein [Pseudobdellovibrio sp.]